ncbi:MAG: flagellar hook-associated protein FlgK [Lachnospiraceae bacterium]|nr:flagellar hook-associated protein FlgK [Lachnospiraceae bacterium]
MGLMSSFYIGTSGLAVSQRALNTVSHNIANVETEGYVRQQVLGKSSFTREIGQNEKNNFIVGYGAETEAIRHVRDIFLDKSYRKEYGRQEFYNVQYKAVSEIEDIFGETEGVAFRNSMNDLWVSIQELCKEPDNIVCRSSLAQTAVSFIERATMIQNQINDYQISLNTKVQTTVDRINEIAERIDKLNNDVKLYEANGLEHANDIRDERDMLLDELSGLINISYKEDMQGIVTVSAEGYPLITGDNYFKINTRTIDGSGGMITPYWERYDADVFDFTYLPTTINQQDVGMLKGLLLSRGNKIGNYTDIPVAPKEKDFADSADYQLALSTFEQQKEVYTHDIESSAVVNLQAQFDQLIHGIVTTVNDLLAPNKAVTAVDAQGNESTVYILDRERANLGSDPKKTPGEALFNRKSVSRYEQKSITYKDENGNTVTSVEYVYTKEDKDDHYSLFTLGEIEVNPAILKDTSLLPFQKNDGTGEYDLSLAAEIMTAWQDAFATLSPNQLTYNNFNGYYTAMIGDIGTKGEQFKTIAKAQESLTTTINNERMSVTAVSTDEELTQLIKYQHAYNASARYINVVSEMLESLINGLLR